MPIIVVEGCDGSGKTSLARSLAHDLHGLYVKTEVRPATYANVVLYDEILEAAQRYTPFVVSDRHGLVSESIYGPIVRQKPPNFPPHAVDSLFHSKTVIYCNPGPIDIRLNSQRVPQMKGVLDKIDDLIWAYSQFFSPRRQWIGWDYRHNSYATLMRGLQGESTYAPH